jgi:integrase
MSKTNDGYSVYFDSSKGCWTAAVSLGFDGSGRRIRRRTSVTLPAAWDRRSVEDQRAQAQKLLAPKVRKLRDEAAKGIKTSAHYKVRHTVEDFLVHGLKGRDENTVKQARSLANNQIIPKIGNYRLRELRAEHVDAWLDEIAEDLATKTVRQVHNLLTRAIRMAEKRDLVDRNVSTLCETPSGQAGHPSKALTLDQAVALIRACDGEPFGAYVIVSLLTGMRTEEARSLVWANVDLDGTPEGESPMPPSLAVWRSVRVGGDTKTKRSRRTLALPQMVVDVLKEHLIQQAEIRRDADVAWKETDLVFCQHDGTQLDAMRVLRGLRRITRKAGLGGKWRARELRHSFVSILSDHGVMTERIADLVGHSTPTTTQTVYRQQIRPVITHGAEAMDSVFRKDGQTG